jgi:hypothetical protein
VGVGVEVGMGDGVAVGDSVGDGVGEVKLAGVSAANIRLRQIVRSMPFCRKHSSVCSCKPARPPKPKLAKHPAMLGGAVRGALSGNMH